MPANKPERPTPGVALVLPRVSDPDTQRALDRIALIIWQLQSQIGRLAGNDIGIFTATAPGLVPAAGVGSTLFLRQDATFALPAGAAVADLDYGDVTVSGGGTIWTVDNLPESRITNLVTDLAAKVPTTRVLNATSPITVNGGASAALSADVTIAIGTIPGQPYYDTVIDMTGTPISFGAAYDAWNVGTLGQNTLIQYITDGAPSGTSSRAVRGLAGGSNGKIATFMNMSPNLAGTAQFQHQTGTAGSAFTNASQGAVTGNTSGCVTYYYDGPNAIWHQIGTT